MRVLVTGGNGFVGSNLVTRLLDKNYDVVILDNFTTGAERLSNRARIVQGSVTDVELLQSLFGENDFDLVYHLAAIVGVKNYLEKPFELIDINIGGTKSILAECMKHNTKLVLASTSELFGKNPNVPWKEDDDRVVGNPKSERWLYGNTKAVCEHMLYAAAKKSGLKMTIVRYYNLYGPRQYPLNVAARWICRALSGQPLHVYGDGSAIRCFTYIEDAVEGTIMAAEKSAGEAFNIGSDQPTKIIELAKKIVTLTKSERGIEFANPREKYGSGFEEIEVRVPSVEKARDILGWSASTSLDMGLDKTVKWYDENRSWWKSLEIF